MYSQAEIFCCKLFLALSFFNLLMGLVFLPTTGIVFRKRNTLCFTCQTLILTHPSWGKKVSNLLSWPLLWCQWREQSQFLWLPSLKTFFWERKGYFQCHMCWLGLALLREDFHHVLALSVPLTLALLPPALGFSPSTIPGFSEQPNAWAFLCFNFSGCQHSSASPIFLLVATYSSYYHIPLLFQSQPALCLLTLETCSDL